MMEGALKSKKKKLSGKVSAGLQLILERPHA